MLRVLVVEADAALTDMMVELLVREGCAVTVVGSIQEAVSRLRRGAVDMVILDADAVPLRIETGLPAADRNWMDACPDLPHFVVVSVHAPSARQLPLSLIPGKDQRGGSNVIWLRKPFRNGEFLSVVHRSLQRMSEAQ
jgi:CheY-like chemotaxis protein